MSDQLDKCPECDGTGRKWYRLPDDVGSPYAIPCPLGCPMIPQPPVMLECVSTAVWSGTFHLFGVEVRCHVLSDGRRIIEAESLAELLAAMANTAHIDPKRGAEIEAFARWQKG